MVTQYAMYNQPVCDIMATCLVRTLLPVITKVKFHHSAPRNLQKLKCLYPETFLFEIWCRMVRYLTVEHIYETFNMFERRVSTFSTSVISGGEATVGADTKKNGSMRICPLPLWYSDMTVKCKYGPVSFNDVTELQNECETVIIDVRERQEVEQTGTVPGTINIPHKEIDYALNNLKADAFRRIYGADKPNKSSFLVLFCRSGSRAKKAMLKLKDSGFENVSFYKGSYYEDWRKNLLKE